MPDICLITYPLEKGILINTSNKNLQEHLKTNKLYITINNITSALYRNSITSL